METVSRLGEVNEHSDTEGFICTWMEGVEITTLRRSRASFKYLSCGGKFHEESTLPRKPRAS